MVDPLSPKRFEGKRVPRNSTIQAVVFDVGETLIDEKRMWRGWATYLGISDAALGAALDVVIDERRHHWEALRQFKPDLDVNAAISERLASGERMIFDKDDLYPDALPCLTTLREHGYAVGIVGNQPAQSEGALTDCGFVADFVGSSKSWGVEKPSPAFFSKVAEAACVEAQEVAYVGDRMDNDILPALDAGMAGIFIERGPWGRRHARWPETSRATFHVQGLMEIPRTLEQYLV
jgi:HAD superfamily hydrolase (TIGR01549 family)